ncbi:ubiquitin-conjugating enzyme/RWD-like protein [Xylariomycetidae sp. FL0641]|nr:ubiquitin-conjugating enzyme/RWD-like protein [Xylariomycetidae sp. FL0641]
MATPRFNTKSPTIKRILREAAELSNSPSPEYTAAPLESDLFEWHFTLRGPPASPFADGLYHGRIVLPPTYPLRPPMFRFVTPSGRFEPNREICLSISGHHEETWQPAWGVRTALVALRAFMETGSAGQIGGVDAPDDVRRRLAAQSRAWRCPVCAQSNQEIMADCEARCAELEESDRKAEVEVPPELKLGFRDDMEKARAAADEGAKEDAESAQLAEGFVQTAPERAEAAPVPPPVPMPPARPAQGVPAPTGRAPLPSPTTPLPPPPQRQVHVQPAAEVPPWIDYAIFSLVIVLLAMLYKILLGY